MGNRNYVLIAVCLTASSAFAQVTTDRLVNASREPEQWLTYSVPTMGRVSVHSGR